MAEIRFAPVGHDELSRIPRWARAAFAVRCAQRLQPLMAKWEHASSSQLSAVSTAIAMADISAKSGNRASKIVDAAKQCNLISKEIADGIQNDHPLDGLPRLLAGVAAMTATTAALCAAQQSEADIKYAVEAALSGTNYEFLPDAGRVIIAGWADFHALKALAEFHKLNDESPVDADRLGGLWPGGRPAGIPSSKDGGETVSGIRLTIEVPDGLPDAKAIEYVTRLVAQLDSMHRVLGGSGLRRLPPSDVHELANVAQGVGS